MLHRMMTLTAALLGAALLVPAEGVAQDKTACDVAESGGDPWSCRRKGQEAGAAAHHQRHVERLAAGQPVGGRAIEAEQRQARERASVHPVRPAGLPLAQATRGHRLSVDPADNNDPRTKCEPLGFPRYNHYDLGIQVFQDEHKIAMLYNFDNRWRMIWTDGRPLPKVVDGGVEMDGEFREARWFGYSVGRWIDDYTLEVVTVGTMPEDRVWLDNTGRPISDQARITERFHRLDSDTLEWSETIDDPKIYTRPWDTMKLRMTLQDSRIDLMTRYCSPVEIDNYNKTFGDAASAK